MPHSQNKIGGKNKAKNNPPVPGGHPFWLAPLAKTGDRQEHPSPPKTQPS
jgi:hypothetical protein